MTELPSNTMGHHGPPEMFDVITDMGCNLFVTANNHAYDLRVEGILRVIQQATARNLAHAGTGRDIEHATAPAFLTTPHGTVALVAMATGAIREDGAADSIQTGCK